MFLKTIFKVASQYLFNLLNYLIQFFTLNLILYFLKPGINFLKTFGNPLQCIKVLELSIFLMEGAHTKNEN